MSVSMLECECINDSYDLIFKTLLLKMIWLYNSLSQKWQPTPVVITKIIYKFSVQRIHFSFVCINWHAVNSFQHYVSNQDRIQIWCTDFTFQFCLFNVVYDELFFSAMLYLFWSMAAKILKDSLFWTLMRLAVCLFRFSIQSFFFCLNVKPCLNIVCICMQITAALGVAEAAYGFEHRDLHW